MAIAPLLNVAKSLAPAVLLKGLTKINPKFKNFFTEAATYGYSADQALDYLKNRFAPDSQYKQNLDKGSQQGNLRPDESADLAQIQNQEMPGKALRSAVAFGGAGLLGASGSTGEEEQSEVQTQNSQQPQYDPLAGFKKHPDLVKFIQKEQSSGGNVQSIASKARKSNKLNAAVQDIENNAQEPFENLLSRLVGSGGGQQQQGAGISPAMSELKNTIQQYMQIKSRK